MPYNKWEWTTLNKLVKIERGVANHKLNCDPSLFCGGNIPLVCCKEVSNSSHLKILKCDKYYNLRGLKQSKLFAENIICVVGCGNFAGDSAILSFQACLSPNLYGLNSYEGTSDPKFIKYCFDYPRIKEKLMKLARSSTAQPHLTFSKLLSIKFPCPPHEIQQKIGDILSAYDEFIENSEQQIEILERVRAFVYKKWFGEFYKKNAILPKEWKFEKLENLVTIKKGTKPASYAIKIEPGGATSTNLSLLYLFSWNSKIQNIFF